MRGRFPVVYPTGPSRGGSAWSEPSYCLSHKKAHKTQNKESAFRVLVEKPRVDPFAPLRESLLCFVATSFAQLLASEQ